MRRSRAWRLGDDRTAIGDDRTAINRLNFIAPAIGLYTSGVQPCERQGVPKLSDKVCGPVAFEVWGLKPRSSQALTTISALKKFYLLEALPQRGPDSGKVRVSDLALSILLDAREDSTEREKLVQQAALKPSIHSELWEHYDGKLPGDAALRFHLQRERKFTESGEGDFLAWSRRTARDGEEDARSQSSSVSSNGVRGGGSSSSATCAVVRANASAIVPRSESVV